MRNLSCVDVLKSIRNILDNFEAVLPARCSVNRTFDSRKNAIPRHIGDRMRSDVRVQVAVGNKFEHQREIRRQADAYEFDQVRVA